MNKTDVAKLKKEGKNFEILIDAEKAQNFKFGKIKDINEVIVTDEIFSDAKKGTRASLSDLKNLFGTDDKLEVCKIIIKEGHLPITAEMHNKEMDQIKRQIVNLIHRNAVDPNTGKPHPITRIENAIIEAKVRIDSIPAEQQVKGVLDKLKVILPIKYEVRQIMIRIPSQYAAKSFGVIKKIGKLLGESWGNDGSLNATIELPAGIQEELELTLNNLTKGNVEIEIMEKK